MVATVLLQPSYRKLLMLSIKAEIILMVVAQVQIAQMRTRAKGTSMIRLFLKQDPAGSLVLSLLIP